MASAISEKYGFIFTHIPKTGGTSIFSKRSPLRHREEFKYIKLAGGHVRLNWLKFEINNYYKFTIVRNPWDRIISMWLVRKRPYLNLDDYVLRLLDRKEGTNFVASQSYWVSDDEGNLLIDKFYRYEEYEDSVKDIYKKFLNVELGEIPHLRKTKRMKDYRKYYNKSSQIEAIAKFYIKDIENFGYEF